MTIATSSSTSASSLTTSSTSPKGTTAAETSDRFLKLLVAQMKNQDPLNPMNNAEVTTQMAQINTVSGIEKLNASVGGLSSSFNQAQLLQGAALVGRDVVVESNSLTVEDGKAKAGYELASAASTVKVEVLSPGGTVLDTLNFNAQTAGSHDFEWTPPAGMLTKGLSFRVSAATGNKTIATTPLNTVKVDSVSAGSSGIQLELHNLGSASLSDIRSIS